MTATTKMITPSASAIAVRARRMPAVRETRATAARQNRAHASPRSNFPADVLVPRTSRVDARSPPGLPCQGLERCCPPWLPPPNSDCLDLPPLARAEPEGETENVPHTSSDPTIATTAPIARSEGTPTLLD